MCLNEQTIYDDIALATSPNKLFHILLKILSLLACVRKLQDLGLSQKKCVFPQIHYVSQGFSPTKQKTCAVG